MKTKIIYLLIIALCSNCKAQQTSKERNKMKAFNIQAFEKNKIGNEYNFITQDSAVIKQSDDGYEYYETIKTKSSSFQFINRYYKTGKIKLEGQVFQSFFQKGVWKEYDEQGNLIKETDYDKPYKFKWEDILAFIKKRGMDMNSYGFLITRGHNEKGTSWSITYNKSEKDMLLGIILIDGITGKIIKEFDQPYPSEE